MLTFRNNILEAGSVPQISYCLGRKDRSHSISLIWLTFLGLPWYWDESLFVSVGHETSSTVRAGAMLMIHCEAKVLTTGEK